MHENKDEDSGEEEQQQPDEGFQQVGKYGDDHLEQQELVEDQPGLSSPLSSVSSKRNQPRPPT